MHSAHSCNSSYIYIYDSIPSKSMRNVWGAGETVTGRERYFTRDRSYITETEVGRRNGQCPASAVPWPSCTHDTPTDRRQWQLSPLRRVYEYVHIFQLPITAPPAGSNTMAEYVLAFCVCHRLTRRTISRPPSQSSSRGMAHEQE